MPLVPRPPRLWRCQQPNTVLAAFALAILAACAARTAQAVHHGHGQKSEQDLVLTDAALQEGVQAVVARDILQALQDAAHGVGGDVQTACEVSAQHAPKELLDKLRDCTKVLEDFAIKTQEGRKTSKVANDEYVEQYSQVMTMLKKLKDIKTMNEAFTKDQTLAMDFLLGETDKLETDIGKLTPSDTEGSVDLGRNDIQVDLNKEQGQKEEGEETEEVQENKDPVEDLAKNNLQHSHEVTQNDEFSEDENLVDEEGPTAMPKSEKLEELEEQEEEQEEKFEDKQRTIEDEHNLEERPNPTVSPLDKETTEDPELQKGDGQLREAALLQGGERGGRGAGPAAAPEPPAAGGRRERRER